MAIQYVGGVTAGRAGSVSTTSQSLTSLSGGIDTKPSEGDLVIVTVGAGSQGRNNSQAIASWDTVGTQLNRSDDTYDTSLQVSYKFMTSTPDTSVTIPSTGSVDDGQARAVMVFRGVDPNTPFDVAAVSATGNNTARFDAGPITPTTAGAWVVICGAGAASTNTTAYTAPTGYTADWLQANGADTNDCQVGMGYYTGWTSGEHNPGVVGGGSTSTSNSWCAWTLALRPAPDVYTYAGSSGATASGGATTSYEEGAVPSVYFVIYPSAMSEPSVAQIKAGQNSSGGAATASGHENASETSGEQVWASLATGLTQGTSYKTSFVWSDSVDNSNVVTSSAWLTDSVWSYSPSGSVTASGSASKARQWAKVGSGTATASGAATVSRLVVKAYATSGTATVSGTTLRLKIKVFATSGSVTSGGTATKSRLVVRSYVATGSTSTSGSASHSRTRVSVTSGTATTSGSATKAKIRGYTATGAILSSGAVSNAKTKSFVGSGVATLSGVATTTKFVVRTFAASGTATTSGGASLLKVKVFAPSGSVGSGGTVGTARVRVCTGSGTATLSGAVAVARTIAIAGSGGCVSGGASSLAKLKVPSPSGSILSDGSATISRLSIRTFVASGVVSTSGASATSNTHLWVVAPAGKVSTSGSASTSNTHLRTFLASGGVTTGYEAYYSFEIGIFVPVLSGLSVGSITTNMAVPTVTMTEATPGYIMWVIYPSNKSDPDAVQMMLMSDGDDDPARWLYVSAAGTAGEFVLDPPEGDNEAWELQPGTEYKLAIVWVNNEDLAGVSNLLVSDPWTTDSVWEYSGSGTITASGSAATSLANAVTYPYVASGVASTSGSSSISKTKTPTASGQVVASGSSLVARIFSAVASGSVSTSGSSTVSREFSFAPEGSVVASGEAQVSRLVVRSFVGSGEVVSGGTGQSARAWGAGGSGVVETSGIAPVSTERVPAAAGGAVVGGSASALFTQANVFAYVGTGGADVGGGAGWLRERVISGAGCVISDGVAPVSKSRGFVPYGSVSCLGDAPVCVVRAPGAGGEVATGGDALTSFLSHQQNEWIASGSAVLSGATLRVLVKVPSLSGGVETGGSASATFTQVNVPAYHGTGSVSVGGEAQTTFAPLSEHTCFGSGSLYVDGVAPRSWVRTQSGAGGIDTDGFASTNTTKTPPSGGGGLDVSGAGILAVQKACTSTGAVSTAGIAQLLKLKVFEAQGWAAVAGAFEVEWCKITDFLVAPDRTLLVTAYPRESVVPAYPRESVVTAYSRESVVTAYSRSAEVASAVRTSVVPSVVRSDVI